MRARFSFLFLESITDFKKLLHSQIDTKLNYYERLHSHIDTKLNYYERLHSRIDTKLNTRRVSKWQILRVIVHYDTEKKVKNPSLS